MQRRNLIPYLPVMSEPFGGRTGALAPPSSVSSGYKTSPIAPPPTSTPYYTKSRKYNPGASLSERFHSDVDAYNKAHPIVGNGAVKYNNYSMPRMNNYQRYIPFSRTAKRLAYDVGYKRKRRVLSGIRRYK